MRNVIITGGELFNKGAQAMTFITVNEIRKRFPHHKIYLLSEMDFARPASERQQYAFDFTGWYPIKFAKCRHNPILRLICSLRNGEELAEAESIYKNCDAMIDISGYALGSNWTAQNNNRYLDHLEFAHAFGIPVYLMPQSFGPFDFGPEHPGIDERCRKLLPGARAILAREQDGYDALVNHYGLTNVRLAPDLVLNNKGIDLANVYAEPPVFSLPEIAENSIGIVPNGRTISTGDEETVLGLYKTIIADLLKTGRSIYLLSHATADSKLCGNIKSLFPEEARVVFLEQDFSCLEFNELVKQFRFVIASRFHSIVHAYKNGIPCVALGWAVKYHELLKQFGQEAYIFDVRHDPDADAMVAAIRQLDARRDEESKKILAALQPLQEHNVFDILES